MRKLLYILILLIAVLVLLFYIKSDYTTANPTIYYNAVILTLDEITPKADAMYVSEGKILSIGTLKDLENDTPEDVVKVNLNGETVMPGFIDPHTHFALSMYMSSMYDLSGFTHPDNDSVWSYFEEVVESTDSGEWIICKGMDPILVKDLILPTKPYLDSIAPDNPVIIFSQSLHSYWADSKAFEKAGISERKPDPSTHSYYERDAEGQFTGLIVEQEAFLPFIEKINEEVITADVLSQSSIKVMREYARNGNTTIVSAGLTINDSKPLILTRHLSAEKPSFLGGLLEKIGRLPKREPLPRHFIYMRYDKTEYLPDSKGGQDDFYDIIGVKHWYDGSPYIGSMYMIEPYLESQLTMDLDIPVHSRGKALIRYEDLKDFIRTYHNSGWQIAIHTQGDAAINEVVSAFSELESELDYSTSRHRLEHCLMLPISTLDEMKQLNISPSFHINHLYYYGEALRDDMLGEERADKILPLQSTLNQDLILTLHADQPMFESRPFRLIQTAVERKTKEGRIINVDEKIELLDAIKALTIHAAWQINMEDKIGSLEVGKYADFIVIDRNPFEIPIENLEDVRIIATYVNGNKVNN